MLHTALEEDASVQSRQPVRARRAGARRVGWIDAVGILYVILVGIAVLIPALHHGLHLGPYDILSRGALKSGTGTQVHNTYVGDQIAQMIPWTSLDWLQVHHGQVPLWNPYSALGMPLAFNWQSAPFGLPALVGYLFPLQYAYTVGVVVTLVVAGSGAYVLARVLHLGVLGCVTAGTLFELSGPFMGWLGWPHASVFSWSGWLFAAALLIVRGSRGNRRSVAVGFFAIVLALSIYAGQPEVLVVMLVALAIFLATLLAQNAWRRGPRTVLRPVLDLILAAIAGFALALPLLLPGLQVFSESIHSKSGGQAALPARTLVYLVVQGFDGLPLAGNRAFGPEGPTFYIGAYVGITALVTAVVGVLARRRSLEVRAFAALGVVATTIVFAPPVIAVFDGIPLIGSIGWTRALLPVGLCVAVLAGVGIDTLAQAKGGRPWAVTASGFAVSGLLLVALWAGTLGGLSATDRTIRAHSLIGPAVEALIGLVVAAGCYAAYRILRKGRRTSDGMADEDAVIGSRAGDSSPTASVGLVDPPVAGKKTVLATVSALALLICETILLVGASAPLWSSSPTFWPTTPAVTAAQRQIGQGVLGVGPSNNALNFNCIGVGFSPNVNIGFGIHELAVYDPMVPKKYFSSPPALGGRSVGFAVNNWFCPELTTAAQARFWGVSYIVDTAGQPAPAGTNLVARLGAEKLYRVPGSSLATATPLGAHNSEPSDRAPGTPVKVSEPQAGEWNMTTSASRPEVIRLRLTDTPGWRASVDGKPVSLEPFGGAMLEIRVPAGRHVVQLRYWPRSFTAGIAVAAATLLALSVWVLVELTRRSSTKTTVPVDPGEALASDGGSIGAA